MLQVLHPERKTYPVLGEEQDNQKENHRQLLAAGALMRGQEKTCYCFEFRFPAVHPMPLATCNPTSIDLQH
jgi:hypothetical protein